MAAGEYMVGGGAGTLAGARNLAPPEPAGIEHYFVEHDEPADPLASVAASYRYLRDLRF